MFQVSPVSIIPPLLHSFIHLPPTMYNVFPSVLQFSPVSIIPPMLQTHSFNYHKYCIMFSPCNTIFSCQYHFTTSQYSFIRLPLTLYNVFLPVLQFPLSVTFHHCSTHLSTYHPCCIKFFSQHFSFPCHYDSTIAPYSFIHLPHILYNVLLPAIQFSLSVSFQHYSKLIHSPTTNAV